MRRFILTHLKPVAIFLSIVFLFQCCIVYDTRPAYLEQALNVNHRKLKCIKIEMKNGNKLILDSIYYRENELYGWVHKTKVQNEYEVKIDILLCVFKLKRN